MNHSHQAEDKHAAEIRAQKHFTPSVFIGKRPPDRRKQHHSQRGPCPEQRDPEINIAARHPHFLHVERCKRKPESKTDLGKKLCDPDHGKIFLPCPAEVRLLRERIIRIHLSKSPSFILLLKKGLYTQIAVFANGKTEIV